jgi:hypothetical protein
VAKSYQRIIMIGSPQKLNRATLTVCITPPTITMTAKTLMFKMIAEMKAQLAVMGAQLAGMEDAMGGPRETAVAPAVADTVVEKPKEKRPLSQGLKNWHDRCQRLDALLKSHELSFKRVAEAKKFASMIYAKEKEVGAEMSEDDIIRARRRWTEEHKPLCIVCKSDAAEDPSQHNACATKFIQEFIDAGKGKKEAGMAEWLKASGLKAPKSDSEGEEEAPKKAGRPKMTEEQKAAAKAAKAAKAALTPEQKAAAKAAKAKTPEQKAKAKTPGAPKKVAWAEGGAVGGAVGGAASAVSVVRNIEAEMDALIATM